MFHQCRFSSAGLAGFKSRQNFHRAREFFGSLPNGYKRLLWSPLLWHDAVGTFLSLEGWISRSILPRGMMTRPRRWAQLGCAPVPEAHFAFRCALKIWASPQVFDLVLPLPEIDSGVREVGVLRRYFMGEILKCHDPGALALCRSCWRSWQQCCSTLLSLLLEVWYLKLFLFFLRALTSLKCLFVGVNT